MAGRGTSLHSTQTSSRLPIMQHAVLFASVIFHPSARTSQEHVFRLLYTQSSYEILVRLDENT